MRPVYHFHLQKSAGTSINWAFFSLALNDPSPESAEALYLGASSRSDQICEMGGMRFGGHRPYDGSQFDYWFSHYCSHDLPKDAYTFTCLRDPVRRLASFLSEIVAERDRGRLAKWNWEAYQDAHTVERMLEITRQRDINHLSYLFSPAGDPNEAYENLRRCTRIIHTEYFEAGMKQISNDLGLSLPVFRARANPPMVLSARDRDLLHDATELDRAIMDGTKSWHRLAA